MASIETVLFTRLDNFAGLSSLVVSRIYPLNLPQSPTYPAVTFTRIGTDPFSGMTEDIGITRGRFQLDAWATTYLGALNVGAQLRLALKRWDDSGTSPVVLDSFLDNELDDFEDRLESSAGVFRVIQDYIIHYRE